MSRLTRKFLVSYILLVGIPLGALAVILEKGRALTAPISVDGLWKLEANLSQFPGLHCLSAAAVEGLPIRLAQSGKQFVLTLPSSSKLSTSGAIEGKTLMASLPPLALNGMGCNADRGLQMIATADPAQNQKTLLGTLSGTLSLDGCESCQPVEFRATRMTEDPRKTH